MFKQIVVKTVIVFGILVVFEAIVTALSKETSDKFDKMTDNLNMDFNFTEGDYTSTETDKLVKTK